MFSLKITKCRSAKSFWNVDNQSLFLHSPAEMLLIDIASLSCTEKLLRKKLFFCNQGGMVGLLEQWRNGSLLEHLNLFVKILKQFAYYDN